MKNNETIQKLKIIKDMSELKETRILADIMIEYINNNSKKEELGFTAKSKGKNNE